MIHDLLPSTDNNRCRKSKLTIDVFLLFVFILNGFRSDAFEYWKATFNSVTALVDFPSKRAVILRYLKISYGPT